MKTLIISHYQFNKDYITANFCENKEKPLLKCEGKCYLQKKLNSDSNHKTSTLEISLESDYFLLTKEITWTVGFDVKDNSNTPYCIVKYNSPFLALLQPPKKS